jgi:hypothetical protein
MPLTLQLCLSISCHKSSAWYGLIVLWLVSVCLWGCVSAPYQRQHQVTSPPPGKATIYFLVDASDAPGSGVSCSPNVSTIQLVADNLTFAGLTNGSWTYVYVEPVPIMLSVAYRQVIGSRMGDSLCSYLDVPFGTSRVLRELTPAPDSVLFMELDRNTGEWKDVDRARVHALLDTHGNNCRECSGKDPNHALQYRAAYTHYIDRTYQRMRCLDDCYRRNRSKELWVRGQLCKQECEALFDLKGSVPFSLSTEP